MSTTAPIAAPAGLAAQLIAGNPPAGTYTPPANPAPAPAAAPAPAPAPAGAPQPVHHPQGVPNPYPALPSVPPVTPPATPTPATPTPVKPEPAKPATDPTVEAQNQAMLDSVVDPQLKVLGGLLRSSVPTLDIDRALGKALEEGRADLIDRRYIREASGEQAAAVEALAEQIVSAAQALAAASAEKVYAAAGGKAQWQAAANAFNASAPAHLKAAAKALLDNGDTEAGSALVIEYAKSSGLIPHGNGPAMALPGMSDTAGGLSQAQFQEEYRKLDKNAPDFFDQRQVLIQRRSAGKAAGL